MQNSDKTLAIALIVSFAGHSFLFVPSGSLGMFDRIKEPTSIKVTYLAPETTNSKKAADSYTKPKEVATQTNKLVNHSEIEENKINSKNTENNSAETNLAALETPKTKTDIDIKKSNANPDYQQLLKAKLKNYGVCPSSSNQGQVNLSFTLSSDGNLKMIKIIENISSNDHQLRLAAIECIKQANPFPPFPENLKMQEATFNVTISFMSE
jgi:TonB family protein